MSVRRIGALAALSLAFAACVAGPSPAPPGDAAPDDASPPSRCRPASGVSGAPKTIEEVVALVNALPRPLALTCFLEGLDRPLDAQAAVSLVSLQPSAGQRSPRIFLFSGAVIMSVAPEGPGQALVELGQLVSGDRSLKGELRFPIAGPLSGSAPLEHVSDGMGTTCRFCHPAEQPAPELGPHAYVSGAFSPLPRARVPLEALAAERAACDDAVEPTRCALLRALFDHGEVRAKDFPATVPTAFDKP